MLFVPCRLRLWKAPDSMERGGVKRIAVELPAVALGGQYKNIYLIVMKTILGLCYDGAKDSG
jgi:hypothetical protein